MADAHSTVEPEQVQTDTFAVFDDVFSNQNLELIGRVEVPRYSLPSKDGVELSEVRRKLLAVARAVEDDDSLVSNGHGGAVDESALVGHNFLVLSDLDGQMDEVPYEQNPAFDAVWDPETDSVHGHSSQGSSDPETDSVHGHSSQGSSDPEEVDA